MSGPRRDLVEGVRRGADDSGPLPELGGNDLGHRSVVVALDVAEEVRLDRREVKVVVVDQAAGDRDDRGIEDVREAHETDGDVERVRVDERDRIRGTGARGGGDVL